MADYSYQQNPLFNLDLQTVEEWFRKWFVDRNLQVWTVQWSAVQKKLLPVDQEFKLIETGPVDTEFLRFLTEDHLKCAFVEEVGYSCRLPKQSPNSYIVEQIVVHPIPRSNKWKGRTIPEGYRFQIAHASKVWEFAERRVPMLAITTNDCRLLSALADLQEKFAGEASSEVRREYLELTITAAIERNKNIRATLDAELLDMLGKKVMASHRIGSEDVQDSVGWADEAVEAVIRISVRPYERSIKTLLTVLGLLITEVIIAAIYIIWRMLT